jgi:Fe-S cluster biogenesis protein NfuA
MFIQTEATSDPHTLTFLPGQPVLATGTAEFPDADSAATSPLARRLFAIEGVEAVTLKTETIDVETGDDGEWTILKPQILAAIMDHFTAGAPALDGDATTTVQEGEYSELATKIKDLIETRIKPAVSDGGGDIAFHSISKGIVYLKLEGSAFGLLPGVQNMIRHYRPEISAVRDWRESIPKPGLESPVGKAVQVVLDERVNPSVASHGGHVSLIDVQDAIVYIRLEGGCQGCGQADVTLKQGIETEILGAVTEVTAVLDTTDHADGTNPYFQPSH